MSEVTLTLDDSELVKLMKRLDRATHVAVDVGILQENATKTHEGGATMVEIAAAHEFGAPAAGIPERSFIRRTFSIKQGDAEKMVNDMAKGVVDDRVSVETGLSLLGAWAVAEIRNTVTQADIPPPLAEATIARKRSSKPLVDTGQLMASLSWALVKR